VPLVLLLALNLEAAPFEVRYGVDGSLTAAAFLAGAAFSLIPVDVTRRWDGELLPFDEGVKQNISARSASMADTLVAITLTLPLAAQLGDGFNEELGREVLIYSETIALSAALNSAAKYLVQRPRPYTYNPSPEVQRYARAEGKDSRLSFYSGHSSLAFTAAVAGSYLFAAGSKNVRGRAAFWGVELALATATANFRVRAGKHFYSDVLVGALLGTALGYVVPRLHESGDAYEPRPLELYAMAGGVVLGALGSQLMPLEHAVLTPVPMVVENGGGVQLVMEF
jgi:membrane-associated phospholipid phosphatase